MPRAFDRVETAEPEAAFVPSAQQEAIFEWFACGKGHLLVRARAGCLAADTMIPINRAGKGWSIPIIQLAMKFNGQPWAITRRDTGTAQRTHPWNPDISTFIQQERDGVIRLGRIKRVWSSGDKPTFKVTLTTGQHIRTTAEHPFLTDDGWLPLSKLVPGMPVWTKSQQRLNGPAPKKTYSTLSGLWHHPFASRSQASEGKPHGSARVPIHRLVVEAAKNGMSLELFLNRIYAGDVEGLWLLNPQTHVIHHRDRNPQNNASSNLELMTTIEHKHLHAHEGTDDNVLFKVAPIAVKTICPVGVEPTFDIEVADEFPHNFVANGFIVHNTGKTETIVRGVYYAPEKNILCCAFNKRIQEALAERLTNPNAHAQTLHSVGYSIIREHWDRVPVSDERAYRLAQRALPYGDAWHLRLLAKLHTKVRELEPFATSIDQVLEVAVEYELLPEPWSDLRPDQLASQVLNVLDFACEPAVDGIDYADMIFLPVRNQWLHPLYDMVIVDEAQDMTAAQLQIAQDICKGRLVLVGDNRQAIYRFRGADTGSLDRLKRALGATELGLTTTYRCPQQVVEKAQHYVPDYRAAPTAPQGTIDTVETLDDLVAQATPGCFILSRTNAPLMPVALRLLRANKSVRIQGRDIGQGLNALARKLAKGPAAYSIPTFLSRLRAWEGQQCSRLQAMGKGHRCDSIWDKADTLRALAQDSVSVAALVKQIALLFADDGVSQQIVCSTVHKVKGLEADHVCLLMRTFSPINRDPACRLEEENIRYVAITRTKSRLTYVT